MALFTTKKIELIDKNNFSMAAQDKKTKTLAI